MFLGCIRPRFRARFAALLLASWPAMRGGDPARCAPLAWCSRGVPRSRRRRRVREDTACNVRSHHLCAACIQSSAHARASAWVALQPPARWRSCAGSIASHSQCGADGHTASMHMRASASRTSRCQICSASTHTRCQCRCMQSAFGMHAWIAHGRRRTAGVGTSAHGAHPEGVSGSSDDHHGDPWSSRCAMRDVSLPPTHLRYRQRRLRMSWVPDG